MESTDRWLAKLAKLSVYKAKGGPAPHKPLLLLVIFELVEQGLQPNDFLDLTPELAFRFCTYWGVVAYRRTQKPDIRLPFYHLQTDGFWTALDVDHEKAHGDRTTRYAALDPDFEVCMRDKTFRDRARLILSAKYFQASEQLALYSLLGISQPAADQSCGANENLIPEEAKQKGREGRFRIDIVAAYNYTCALTGYRLMTIDSGTIIDAAHIHQFAKSRNNDIRNGLALSKNSHWLFDNGLWTLDDDYRVLVADASFAEDSPDQRALREYRGERVRLPSNPALHPDPKHLAWHRTYRFQR